MTTDAEKSVPLNNYVSAMATETEFLVFENFVQILEGGQLVQLDKINHLHLQLNLSYKNI